MKMLWILWVVAAGLLVGLTAGSAAAQETAPATSPPTSTTTQATSQPAPPENLLASPRDLVDRFRATASAALVGQGSYDAAMQCLDLGPLAEDQERLKHVGPDYVRQLLAILQRLQTEERLDLESTKHFPRDPAIASPHSVGQPPVVLVLTRVPRQVAGQEHPINEWKFSWATVEHVPEWFADLDTLFTPVEQPEAAAPAVEELRAPRHLVTFFLQNAAAVRQGKDPEAYQAALTCLDFAEVIKAAGLETAGEEAIAKFKDDEGTTYIAGLEHVLEALLDDGGLVIEKLPDKPDPDRKPTFALAGRPRPGAVQLSVLLVRQGDVEAGTSQWRFSADTVRRIPEMAGALEVVAEIEEEAKPAGPEPAREETRSARATLETFRTAMKEQRLGDAVACLDLTGLTPAQLELADTLAGKLLMVMARKEKVLLQTVPDEAGATAPYSVLKHRAGRIQIGPRLDDDGNVQWLFTRATVDDIEPLYEAFQSRPLNDDWKDVRLSFWSLPALYVREFIIPTNLKQEWLGLKLWQWIGTPAGLLLGWIVFGLCQVILPQVARWLLKVEGQALLPQVVRAAMRPTSLVAMVVAWWCGFQVLDLGGVIMAWTFWVLRILMTIFGTFALFRLVGLGMSYFRARASQTQSRVDDVLVPLLEKTLKVVTVALGVVFVINVMFNVDIGPLFAGLGVGGFAVAFAAQDTIKNFFGSVNVVLDRPFQVGDWVKMAGAEGTVEAVGLRSCKIRTFYNSQIVIPNSEIMNATVDNMGRRRYRRTSTAISVTYDTAPEKLEAFCEGIRELIRKHPATRKDYFHVYVKEFAPSSIDIMLYCFHECADWGVELRERHRLYLDIIRLAQRLGVSFAFPTQTLHVHQEAEDALAGPPVPTDSDAALQFGVAQARAVIGPNLPPDA